MCRCVAVESFTRQQGRNILGHVVDIHVIPGHVPVTSHDCVHVTGRPVTADYHVTSQPPTVARLRSFTWSNDTPQRFHFVSTPFILLGRFRRFPAEGHSQSISSCRLGFLYRETILMDLEYRNLLAPNGPPLFPSDFRSPRLPRPAPGEFLQRSPESGEMEKTPPVTGKRRGGSRKACNECKQQKVRPPCWQSCSCSPPIRFPL